MCVEDTADGSTLSRRLLVCTGPCCNKGGISDLLLTELRATLLVLLCHKRNRVAGRRGVD